MKFVHGFLTVCLFTGMLLSCKNPEETAPDHAGLSDWTDETHGKKQTLIIRLFSHKIKSIRWK